MVRARSSSSIYAENTIFTLQSSGGIWLKAYLRSIFGNQNIPGKCFLWVIWSATASVVDALHLLFALLGRLA